jgi:hypothetical protein
MDLGPRDEFAKEICFNPQLDGYLVETIQSSSYNDTSDILLYFILSRLLSSTLGNFLNTGTKQLNALFSREEDRLDGDLVQLFSINSEYGVAGFSEDEYDGTGDIYISTSGPATVGVFFTSTTENRIVVSPGITTFTPQLTNFYGYPKTQEVPFYQWTVNNNTNGPNTIFGSQSNDWNTTPLDGVSFFSEYYQSLDRLVSTSRYFRTNNLSQTKFFKGYIYSVDGLGNLSYNTSTRSPNTPTQPTSITVGAPFYFYFGLTQGASAFDKFARIWIEQ